MNVVILPGWGHNKYLWDSFVKRMGKDTKAIDLPGFGDQPLINEDWSISEYADWVEKNIGQKKSVILLGHSFGGRISAEIASRNPSWLRGLILSGAPCLYRPSVLTRLKIMLYKATKIFLPRNIRNYFYSTDLKESKNLGLEKIFRKVVVYDQTNQLKKIKVPTLLIWGRNDNQVPLQIAQEMNRLISNSELKVIENSGHNVYLEKPDLFFGYVKNYLLKFK